MRLGRYLAKDKRNSRDIMAGAVKKVERGYSPLVGNDENGSTETEVDEAMKIVEPYAYEVKEVDLYA